jgi:hypothetical protein
LTHISSNQLSSWNDFTLIVNGYNFEINFPLSCCVSPKFIQTNMLRAFECFLSEDIFPIFQSFLLHFEGCPFNCEDIDFKLL